MRDKPVRVALDESSSVESDLVQSKRHKFPALTLLRHFQTRIFVCTILHTDLPYCIKLDKHDSDASFRT